MSMSSKSSYNRRANIGSLGNEKERRGLLSKNFTASEVPKLFFQSKGGTQDTLR